jgi:hypothetical protein
MNLLEKLDQLRQKFDSPAYKDDPDTINAWDKEAKRAMLVGDLKSHEGIKMIVDKLANDIAEINVLLSTARSDKFSDATRDRVLDKKELYLWFLGLFPGAEKRLREIEKMVDENLQALT